LKMNSSAELASKLAINDGADALRGRVPGYPG